MSNVSLKNFTLDELEEFVMSIGEKKFRAKQIFKWMYQKRLRDFSEMTNMPKSLRESLAQRANIGKLETRKILESSRNDAVKFGFALPGAQHVFESVLLIDGDRRTACISSQIGCALGCSFCETAKLGFIRNLTQEEIIGQLVGINDYLYEKYYPITKDETRLVTNIVFMGMGEALANFENFRKSLSVIMHEDAFNIGARRITVSTAGVVPSIEKLMREDLTIGLAISLNAWNNELRDKFMPINKKYPIEELTKIAKKYHAQTGRRVTFEYVLINGVTDTQDAANALEKLLGNFPCKINLIPINCVNDNGGDKKYNPPTDSQVEKFAKLLHDRDLAATIRKSRGQDIMGACGQLTTAFESEAR